MNKLDIVKGKIIYAETYEDAEEIMKIFEELGAINEWGCTPSPRTGYFITRKNEIRPTSEYGEPLEHLKDLLKYFEYPKWMRVSDIVDSDMNLINPVERYVVAISDNFYHAWDETQKDTLTKWRYAEEIKQKSNADKEAIELLAWFLENIKKQINNIENRLDKLTNEI